MALRRQARGDWRRHARARNAGLGMAPEILAPEILAPEVLACGILARDILVPDTLAPDARSALWNARPLPAKIRPQMKVAVRARRFESLGDHDLAG